MGVVSEVKVSWVIVQGVIVPNGEVLGVIVHGVTMTPRNMTHGTIISRTTPYGIVTPRTMTRGSMTSRNTAFGTLNFGTMTCGMNFGTMTSGTMTSRTMTP
jgi:hypothetical protein